MLPLAALVGVHAQGTKKPITLTGADYAEIERLSAQYSHAIDTCADNGYAYADLYTPDGVFIDMWSQPAIDAGGAKWQGREKLREIRQAPLPAIHTRETSMRITRMTMMSVAIAVAVGFAALAGVAHAQGAKATINDPVGPLPDPTHIPIVLPKDIKWNGQEGRQQQAVLFGDPSKPGIYGVVIKWYPGNFSQPHFHDQERYAYVISGTWWVSTSNVYDEKTTYPVGAGTVAIDAANTVHWDGARLGEKEPAVLVLVGMGPVRTVQVDENGKPKAPPPAR